MYSHQISKTQTTRSTLMRVIIGLWLWIICTLIGIFILNKSRGFPIGSVHDNSESTWDIPSIGDYLFDGSGWTLSGLLLSGESLTGATGQEIEYPSGYIDQFNKALLILQNDTLVNTTIDTDNLISSGFEDILLVPGSDQVVSPNIKLQWAATSNIEKLWLLWVNKDGAYVFENIPFTSDTRQFDINQNKGNIKPGFNTYYIIWKRNDNFYSLAYQTITTYEGAEFYKTMDKICILDFCSDPNLPKTIQPNSDTILQQSADGKTVIQAIPEQSITIARKEDWQSELSLKQAKKMWDYYYKLQLSPSQAAITQWFYDKNGNKLADKDVKLELPNRLDFGNVRYLGPKLSFENNSLEFQSVKQIQSSLIIDRIKSKMLVEDQVGFLLPNSIYVIYTLDKSSLKVVNPSWPNNSYKVIPKIADWMKNAIVYTVWGTDIGAHDTIVSHFKWSIIQDIPNCPNRKTNSDSSAKFGIFPIDGQYDVVGFWGCYGIK